MTPLAVLDRPGLDARERVLVLATCAAARADWVTLGACADAARARGVPRAELEETLLQGVLFYGFPRSMTAFETLARHWPAATPPIGGSLPPAEQRAAGDALFDAIYADNSAGVRAMLRGWHGELHEFVLDCAYGRILARPGLAARTRELCACGALAVLDQTPQLVAHARGALRLGADRVAVTEALITALGAAPEVDRIMRRVDHGSDAAPPPG